ncbi:hypothetical protein OCAR_6396 [Afipia carboxidovorans OM5]|nr:hypothetical protein OCAR_6396 [Afipia carboxidovorans OM5]
MFRYLVPHIFKRKAEIELQARALCGAFPTPKGRVARSLDFVS